MQQIAPLACSVVDRRSYLELFAKQALAKNVGNQSIVVLSVMLLVLPPPLILLMIYPRINVSPFFVTIVAVIVVVTILCCCTTTASTTASIQICTQLQLVELLDYALTDVSCIFGR